MAIGSSFSTTVSVTRHSSDAREAVAPARSWWDRLAFGLTVRAEFYTAMADFSKSGIAPYPGIMEMLGVAKDRWSKKWLVKVYTDITNTLETGVGLPTALAPWIPPAELSMLRGAEEAGPAVLNTTFGELGNLLLRQSKARGKLYMVLGMNAFNLTMVIGVMMMVLDTLVPVIDKISTPALAAKMPFAMAYFGASKWVINEGLYLLLGIIAAGFGIAWSLPNWASEHRRVLDQYVPPYSVYQRLQATLFLSTAASMMRAGITLNKVLKDANQFSSKWMRHHIQKMLNELGAGHGEVNALSKGPLPNDTADTLRVYRLIPKFQDVMTRLSEANFIAYEKSIDRIASISAYFSMFLTTGFGVATTIAMFNFSDAIQAASTAVQHAAGG